MSEPNKAVFLSYASQDIEAARRICDALRTAGIEVWFDQSELRGGDAWDYKIRQQVRDCALFVPIISANTECRTEGYFRREWRLAVDRTHDMSDRVPFLVPVVIDDMKDKGSDVPESFVHVQWTRLPGGETPPTFCERVKVLLGGQSTAQPHSAAGLASIALPKPTSHRWRIVAAAGVLVVLVGGWQAWRLITPKAAPRAAATAVAVALSPHSVAVLPFVNMSGDKGQEFFSDGMTEEITAALAKISNLHVVGRTSAFQFKGENKDLRAIGRALSAAYLIEGSVRKDGNEVRITAQLIRADDGTHLWTESYNRELKGVFAIQESIAKAIATSLRVPLGLQRGPEPRCQSHYGYGFLSGLPSGQGVGAWAWPARTGRATDRGGQIAGTGCRPRSELCPRLGVAGAGVRLGALLYTCTLQWRDRCVAPYGSRFAAKVGCRRATGDPARS